MANTRRIIVIELLIMTFGKEEEESLDFKIGALQAGKNEISQQPSPDQFMLNTNGKKQS